MKNCFPFFLFATALFACGESQKKEQDIASKKILKAYQEWVYMKVKKGENWYESKWQAALDKRTDPLMIDNCKEGLPDDFHRIQYGDINQDGKLDAIATIVPLPCDGGTAHRFQEIELAFLSANESYSSTESFDEIISSMGLTGHIDTITENGIIHYTFLEHRDNDAMCCPSIETKAKFKYQNGGFISFK